MVLEVIAIL